MTFKRVLVATDLSRPAEAAAQRAARLAQRKTTYRLLHVLEPGEPTIPPHTSAPARPLRAAREAAARDALDSLADVMEARSVDVAVRRGRFATAVSKEAREFRADLVVVGARGHTDLPRILLGSRARALLRTTPTSVLVARGRPPSRPPAFRRVALLTDFNEPSRIAAARARRLAREMDAELFAVHVFDPSPLGSYLAVPADVPLPPPSAAHGGRVQEAVRDLLHAFNRKELGGKAREVVVTGQPTHAIPELARRKKIDLLVVGTHGRGRLGRAIIGSVAESVAERADCAVLVARQDARS